MWSLTNRLGGQLRLFGHRVVGFDMTAALAMADALGIHKRAVMELLPGVESAMVRKLSEIMEGEYSD